MRSVVAVLVLLLAAAPAWAAEARCNVLGANCVCSEPFNTASYTRTSWSGGACTGADGCYHNPGDTTVKECSYETTGAPTATYIDFGGSSNATAKAALPTGHSVQFFGAREEGHAGTWFTGAEMNMNNLGATFNARMSLRFYSYHSPNYNFRDENPPCHSKFLQGHPGAWHFENFTGDIHMYDFFGSNWGPASAFPRDCCFGRPGATFDMQKAYWKGRWWFVEVVTTNRSGPGWRTILYMRDVTAGGGKINNGVEFVAADTFGTSNGVPQPWTAQFNTIITSSPRQHAMKFNGYREVGQGQCLGFRGISHLMYAGWDTDAGQRIGAATEVESGGGPVINHYTLLSTAGTYGLTGTAATLIKIVGPTKVGFIHTAVLVVIIVAALALAGGKVRR